MIPLNKEEINQNLLSQKMATAFNLHLFNSIDSTNRYLNDLPITKSVDICCAELQTHGRGRFGRHWHSPFGENIYCSSRWNLQASLSKLSGLSLISSLAVLATLKQLNISPEIKIKWPNDILWRGKKLCGILIEIFSQSKQHTWVIIGIGLNVNTDTQSLSLGDQAWCSLYEISKHYFNRNLLITKLILNLEAYLSKFIHSDLSLFMDEWNQSDYLAGSPIKITQGTKTFFGLMQGVNPSGQLILQDEAGTVHLFSSGDSSLHETKIR